MGWKQDTTPSEPIKKWTEEELLKKETTWISAYNEPEKWIKDFKEVWYSLVAEYEIEKNLVLYRFELDETHRKDLMYGASHFQNVVIKTDQPQVVLSETLMLMHKRKEK